MREHPLFRHLALSAALALAFHLPLEALAQTPPNQVKITTWGTRTFALGNFTGTKDLGILAGMTLGSNNLMGVPSSVEVKDQGGGPLSPKASLALGQHIARLYQVQAGQVYQGEVRYAPAGYKALYIRVRASQGTVLNTGTVILTDAPDYQRSSANLVYGVVRASGSVPTWEALLGAVFWVSIVGAPIAAALWGSGSGSAEYTLTFPPGTPSTVTLYYKMTGCTARIGGDYNGSFTVPVSSLQPGVAYGVDIYGWCGGGGVGNWARASQRALTPAALNTSPGRLNVSVPGLSGVYVDVVWQAPGVSGPDDCSGMSASFYSPSGGGIEFKMSGEECWPTTGNSLGVLGFGGPGPTGGVRTTLPSLSFQGTPTPWLYGVADEPLAAGQVSPSSVNITFTPRGYYMGSFYTVSQPGTATAPGGGGSVSGTGLQALFSPSDPMVGLNGLNVLDNLSNVSLPTFTLTFPAGAGSCTLTNNNSTSYTLYQILPPGSYTLNPGGTAAIQAPQYTLGAKGSGSNTLSLPKGFYYIAGQSQLPAGVSVSGCTVAYGQGSAAADTYVSYRAGVFALR